MNNFNKRYINDMVEWSNCDVETSCSALAVFTVTASNSTIQYVVGSIAEHVNFNTSHAWEIEIGKKLYVNVIC